ncbi:MAG TPA: hypothetical protein VNZ22_02420, partial [Bacillota bacterium]|nr:hypothetical protein [Bacillota bacterium]
MNLKRLIGFALPAGGLCLIASAVSAAAPIRATATLDTAPGWNAAAGAGLLTDGVIGGNEWVSSGQYLGWADASYVPTDAGTNSDLPQPQLTFDLGGKFLVDSVTIHYIVDYPAGSLRANLRAPDSMAVTFSSSGTAGPFGGDLVEMSFDDSTGANKARSVRMSLGGAVANAVRLDFRTDGEWMFLSEVVFEGRAVTNAPIPATASLDTTPGWNAAGGPALLTDGVIGGNNWLGGGYLGWSDPGYVATPPDSGVDSAVPQPQLTFDFGATQRVDSVTIHYMVDYPGGTLRANVRAPDSLTVMFGLSGPNGAFGGNLAATGFNDGPESDAAAGGGEARSLTIDLGGTLANAMRLDFRTDGEWLMLSEVTFNTLVEATNPPPVTNILISATATLDTAPGWNAAAGPGLLTDGAIGGNEWIASGQYLGWSDARYAPVDGGTDAGLPQPQLTFDLAANFFVDNVTIHYLVDYPAGTFRANLRAPDSMALKLSTGGPAGPFSGSVVAASFDDSPENNATAGWGEARSLTVELGGAPANAVRLDFLTDGEWLFLSEVVIRGRAITNAPTPIRATVILDTAPGFNAAAGAASLTNGVFGNHEWLSSGQYLGWSDAGYVPTPPDSGVDSGLPQPQLTFDFGGRYWVNSVTVHYMVDFPPDTLRANIRGPDSMTAMFSLGGSAGP